MGKLDGKVAVVTGAARGQGRSHAVALAEEGADIIALDICEDIGTTDYALARPEDLDQTKRLVEAAQRSCVALQADVRDASVLRAAIAAGVAQLGRLDIVVANAGICPLGGARSSQAFIDAVDVDLVGVINTVSSAFSYLTSGASIIATGSVAALTPGAVDRPEYGPGGYGYSHSKRAVARYIHDLAIAVAPQSIRANAVHPCNVNTEMLHSDVMYRVFRPDLEAPTRADAEPAFLMNQRMPIPWVEPDDISRAVVYLASDDAKYVTGLQMTIDAGASLAVRPAIAHP